MSLADRIRERGDPDVVGNEYACRECGIPLSYEYGTCPECGEGSVVPIERVIDAEFTDER